MDADTGLADTDRHSIHQTSEDFIWLFVTSTPVASLSDSEIMSMMQAKKSGTMPFLLKVHKFLADQG